MAVYLLLSSLNIFLLEGRIHRLARISRAFGVTSPPKKACGFFSCLLGISPRTGLRTFWQKQNPGESFRAYSRGMPGGDGSSNGGLKRPLAQGSRNASFARTACFPGKACLAALWTFTPTSRTTMHTMPASGHPSGQARQRALSSMAPDLPLSF
jgi:hypothetical protein